MHLLANERAHWFYNIGVFIKCKCDAGKSKPQSYNALRYMYSLYVCTTMPTSLILNHILKNLRKM